MRSTLFVLAAHLTFLGLLFYTSPSLASKPVGHPIAVHFHEISIVPQELVREEIVPRSLEKKEEIIPKGLEKEEKLAPPKPENRPPPVPKKLPAKPKKVTPKAASPAKGTAAGQSKERDKLISLMQDSLKTLDGASKRKTPATPKTTPSIGPLASEALSFSPNYEQTLIADLEALLELPEKGEVKIKLTLNRQGKVERVCVEKAPSSRNRAYIEEALSALTFLPFGNAYKGEQTHTFCVTFTSEVQ